MSDQDKNDDKKDDDKKAGGIAQKLFDARQILICEAIDQKMSSRVVSQLLALAADNDDDITLFLNSQGGHVEAGDSINDVIRFIKPRVKIVGTGWVASAGTHIFIAVDKEDRVCLPNTRFLIHQPSGGVGCKVTDIAIQAEQIEIMLARLARIISEQTGQKLEKVMKDIERDYWMDTKEAMDYGILSKVIHHASDL